MSEVVVKDYSIKLFGKTIEFNLVQNTTLPEQIVQSSSVTSTSQDTKDLSSGNISLNNHSSYESTNPTEETSSEISEEIAPPCLKKDSSSSQESSNKNEKPNDEKALKKPEEILPCPRCESMDTKFCYFNNYNVNQPRYFCRKCQRYWTCGGTMRNVPIGSGRRKNKNVVVQNYYRHITVQNNGPHLNPNGFLILDEGSNKFSTTSSYAVPSGFPWFSPPIANPGYSVLGKHSREEITMPPSVLVPKKLRLDHRSVDNTARVLHANPAALSRSHNFHESA